ncbi:hypothetical protein AB3M81_07390 [Aeromicrobium sp. 179-A 4D2 NHS]
MQINWRAPDLTDKNDRIMRLDTRAFLCHSVGAALFLMGGSVLFGLAFGGHISVPAAIAVGGGLGRRDFPAVARRRLRRPRGANHSGRGRERHA